MNNEGRIRYNRECNLIYTVENNNFKEQVLTALKKDKFVKQILNNITDYSSFKKQTGLLLFNELIYISDVLHCKLVSETHSATINNYQEIKKTLKRLTRTYYFLHMRKKVEDEVQKCNIC